jgi:hypothetical protein
MRLVVASLGCLLLFLAACGGGGRDDTELKTIDGAGVSVEISTAWVSESTATSLLVAPDQAALEAEPGIHFRAELSDASAADLDAAVSALSSPEAQERGESLSVVEEPSEVRVGGKDGVAITLQETVSGTAVTTRYVFVNVDGARTYLFTLQAPSTEWESHESGLVAALESVRFG